MEGSSIISYRISLPNTIVFRFTLSELPRSIELALFPTLEGLEDDAVHSWKHCGVL